jgi:hypothetical protein
MQLCLLVEQGLILLVRRIFRVGGARQHHSKHGQWQVHDEL